MGTATSKDLAASAVYSSLRSSVPLIAYRSFTIVAVNWGTPFWSTNVAWFPLKVTNHPSLSSLLIDIRFAKTSGQWRALLKVNTFWEPATDDFRAMVLIP